MRSAAAEQGGCSVAGETVVGSELCVMGHALDRNPGREIGARFFKSRLGVPFRTAVQAIDFSAVEFCNFFGMRVDFTRELVGF